MEKVKDGNVEREEKEREEKRREGRKEPFPPGHLRDATNLVGTSVAVLSVHLIHPQCVTSGKNLRK